MYKIIYDAMDALINGKKQKYEWQNRIKQSNNIKVLS